MKLFAFCVIGEQDRRGGMAFQYGVIAHSCQEYARRDAVASFKKSNPASRIQKVEIIQVNETILEMVSRKEIA